MIIQKAKSEDYNRIRLFYHALIDDIQNSVYRPGWQKDIYPDPDELKQEIREGSLYCGYIDKELVASMVVNQKFQDDAYADAMWKVDATSAEILVIHMLGVGMKHAGQGYGRQMVRFVIDMAEQMYIKAVRLDVLKGNLPAERLYTSMGFQFRNTVPMYYPDVGWMEFELYEYVL